MNRKIYYITTGLLAVFILSGIFFINAPAAIEGTRHLGLPEWFRWELSIANIIGGLLLILPFAKKCFGGRLREWAYVALGIVYVSALIAHLSVDGFVAMSFAPVVAFALLLASYVTYHKTRAGN